ncbi:ACP-like domain-containing protein [Rappaport israeli]|uniref:ACP-like domain-containing protein n=1 Tax=Rappaport israeli TaxID=1839807 RepID=UPI001178B155|nr:hypothetical protein [Rappaport israeli]
MKKILFTAMSIALASTSMTSSAQGYAFSDTVQYSCQIGGMLNVTYSFNMQGIPEKAVVNLQGEQRTLPIIDSSDSVETNFGKNNSYRISSDYMDSENYHQSSIMVSSPSKILYKNCSAQNFGTKTQKQHSNINLLEQQMTVNEKTVHYKCDNNINLDVKFGFNREGLPTEATTFLNSSIQVMKLNLGNSNAYTSVFEGENGYRLDSSGITLDNANQSSVLITKPNNQLIKNCVAK